MLKTIRVNYLICSDDSVLINLLESDNDFILLWNNEGLYRIFPSVMLTATAETHFLVARWSDGYQIPVETARLLTGE